MAPVKAQAQAQTDHTTSDHDHGQYLVLPPRHRLRPVHNHLEHQERRGNRSMLSLVTWHHSEGGHSVRVCTLLEVGVGVGVCRWMLEFLQAMGMAMELVLVQGVLWSTVKLRRRKIVLWASRGMRQTRKPRRDYCGLLYI